MPYPDFQIDWLRAFVAVVDAGSLSKAAPLVHRSQSGVSMQIQKLEAALGVMDVAVLRSKQSQRQPAVDAMYARMLGTLATPGMGTAHNL